MLTIEMDATRAMARFGPSGIPMRVRENLRRLIPPLTRDIGSTVDSKLASGLKSRRRLETKIEMVENPREIYGRVRVVWTGEAEKSFIPIILESGAAPHIIQARNAMVHGTKNGRVLSFYWPRIGGQAFFPRVNHPGFAGIHYMHETFAEMEAEIRERLNAGIRERLAA